MDDREKALFDIGAEGFSPSDPVRARVRFLPPSSFCDPVSDDVYDAVFIMNALNYVTPDQQTVAIRRAARQAESYVFLTSFHPDTIRADIERAGLRPLPDALQAIHEGWGDRVKSYVPQPGSPEYSWALPPFETDVPDRPWRFCALFAKA